MIWKIQSLRVEFPAACGLAIHLFRELDELTLHDINDLQAGKQVCQPAATGGEELKLSSTKLSFTLRWLRNVNKASVSALKAVISNI